MKRFLCAAFLATAALAAAGCESNYVTPGERADFSKIGLTPEQARAMTDVSVREALAKRPMVVFPAALAVVRVQSGDYGSHWSGNGPAAYGRGAYSVITVRDVEKDEDFKRISQLPQIMRITSLNRMTLPEKLESDLELRAAAAKLHAGLLLFYTFDTKFYTDAKAEPLGVITLGLAPNRVANVTSTASAVLMDVNNGYIYGVYEATSKHDQLANAWTSDEALEAARKRAERQAFEKLVGEFTAGWPAVLTEYAPRAKASADR